MKITLELLEEHDACEEQRNKFEALYPEGAELTVESLAQAREQGFDVRWLECLIPLGRWEAYYAATDAAREGYYAASAAMRGMYDAATVAALVAARAACDAAINAALVAAFD